jgi:KUP system potassium uptake protein
VGQIYVPAVNWALMAACITLVLGFRSSSHLAAAYGVAVTTTMVVTTLLFYVLARERWNWHPVLVAVVAGFFLLVDLAFWGANLLKIPRGGWFPLVVGASVFTLLTTWKTGRSILAQRLQARTLPREMFLSEMERNPPLRVRGTAVFMYSNPNGTPPALLHNLKHNQVLHDRVVFLSVATEDIPYVEPADRVKVSRLGEGIFQIILRGGFMEDINIPETLSSIRQDGLEFKPMMTTYFLGRETLIATKHPGMAVWRERLFSLMARNAKPASSYFYLPPNRVVELGAQIEL